jgi:tRNA pseudouridine38-40 synthase
VRYKLTLEYDGTYFFGWQVQRKTGERTVQGCLETALSKLPGMTPTAWAAGRTDRGVHALAMVAHCDGDGRFAPEKLQRALNAHLPPDVRVLEVEHVADDFHAQYDCLYREYIYKMKPVREGLSGTALDRHFVLHLPKLLNFSAMQQAAPLFEGKHDFAALATQETRGTVREVLISRLEHTDNTLEYHVAATGFLRNMVRAMVGTLLQVGEGKLAPEDVPTVIASQDRAKAGMNVPPHGLYFVRATYERHTV